MPARAAGRATIASRVFARGRARPATGAPGRAARARGSFFAVAVFFFGASAFFAATDFDFFGATFAGLFVFVDFGAMRSALAFTAFVRVGADERVLSTSFLEAGFLEVARPAMQQT